MIMDETIKRSKRQICICILRENSIFSDYIIFFIFSIVEMFIATFIHSY